MIPEDVVILKTLKILDLKSINNLKNTQRVMLTHTIASQCPSRITSTVLQSGVFNLYITHDTLPSTQKRRQTISNLYFHEK